METLHTANMAANREMSEWLLFFREAGVPVGPAASYANTFVDNRISKSMLMDLTKEYLKEMGIGVMGDVIAILKYAKTAYSKYERDRPAMDVLPKPADGKVELKRKTTVIAKPDGTSGQRIASLPYQAGSRMLEHYLRKEGILEGSDATPTKVKVSTEMAARLGAVPLGGSKKRITASSLGTVEVIPMKRIRKVDPAEEGAYIISMPKGITARTQKILQQKQAAKPAAGKSGSVFARLGGGSPGSPNKAGSPSTTVMTVGVSGQANVFNRLGGVTTGRLNVGPTSPTEVGYHGVLKAGAPTAKRAAQPTVVVTLGRANKVTASTVPKMSNQDRLGIQKPEISTTTMTHMDSVAVKSSLQMRLGAQGKSTSKTYIAGLQGSVRQMTPTAVSRSPALLKRLGTQVAPKENSGLQQRLGALVKPHSPALQARLGKPKRVTVTLPKDTPTTSPAVGKLVIRRPAHSVQASLGAKTGKATMPKKNSLADRLGAKVNTALSKSSPKHSPASAGIFSRDSPTTSMASDRAETGVMKRLGMPVSGGSQSQITFQSRLGPQKSRTSPTMSKTIATNQNRPDLRVRLGVQKAEASSTTPSLGLTVTTSGSGEKIVQNVGKKRKLSTGASVGLGRVTPKMRRVSSNSGVFSRLGATI